MTRTPPGRPELPARGRELPALLERALGDQRRSFADMVDNDVLQYACAARQDMQEIERAHPSDALTAAVRNLTEAIDALRRLVSREERIDEQLVIDAEMAISWAFAKGPAGETADDRTTGKTAGLTFADLAELSDMLNPTSSPGSAEQVARLEGGQVES